jgi:hypothetical protein
MSRNTFSPNSSINNYKTILIPYNYRKLSTNSGKMLLIITKYFLKGIKNLSFLSKDLQKK